MNRKQFLKTSILGMVGGFVAPKLLAASNEPKFRGQKLCEINDDYTFLARIAPLGTLYIDFSPSQCCYDDFFDWKHCDEFHNNHHYFFKGYFKYNLVDTIEKKIYYWKGLLSFYKDQKISNEFNNIPLINWLIEIFFSHKFLMKDSFIFLGYPEGKGYVKYEINPVLSKFIENYPDINKGNVIIKDMSIYL